MVDRDLDDAARMLAVVHPVPLNGETLEVRYVSSGDQRPVREFHCTARELLDGAARRLSDFNVFYGVTLRRGGGRAEPTSRANACWADLDDKLFAGDSTATLAAVDNFCLQPSVLVASGGGCHP